MIKDTFIKYKFLVFVIFIAILSVINLASYGIPPTHDGEYHVIRFEQFFKAVNQGTLYPRWAQDFNNGYGIPLFNYVYPLPNYVATITHLLGFSFINSFKLNMIFATIIGSIFFYLWTKRYWGDWGGVVSAVFYTYAPYHLLDIYVRGSVGEVWSLGLAPALFWSYLNFHESRKIKYFILSSMFLSLLVFAHNILALVFFAFFILYSGFLILNKKENIENRIKDFMRVFCVLIFGLGLSAVFWLPAILETKYVTGLQIFDLTRHFPVIYKLIYSSWGYGFSGQNVPDQMSLQIGIANIFILLICCFIFVLKQRERIMGFFILLFFLTLFLITPFSKIVWDNFPLISYVQFPWRLLSVLIFISSFMAGFLVSDNFYKGREKKKIFISLFLIFMSVILSINYIKAPFYHQRNDEYYLSRENFTKGTNSPGNVFNTINFNPKLKESPHRFTSNTFEIQTISSTITKEKAIIRGKRDGVVLVNIAYFPGWSASLDGSPHPIRINSDGLFEVDVPAGDHEFEVVLKSTYLQTLSFVVTVFSLLFLFCLFMWDKYIKIKR